MRSKSELVALFALLLAGCGGGSDDPPPAPPQAPSALSYPAAPALTRGVAMAPLAPAVTGNVTAWTVSPALPAGLALNATSGQISGTPTAIVGAANYQVTAANAAGSTSATVALTVNDTPPDIAYAPATYTLIEGTPAAVTPSNNGGVVVSWSVDPGLPAGLAFSAATGAISGTPTTGSNARTYVVTAQNSGGTDTFNLQIGVSSFSVPGTAFLELGHDREISEILHDGNRIMSRDQDNRAVLWNAQTGAILLSTNDCRTQCIALAGTRAAFHTTPGFDVVRTSDGAVQAHIARPYPTVYWWALADDGSYLCSGSATELQCWSSQGDDLFTRAGDYRNGRVFAAATELRVARGAAGDQVIEKLAMPAGTSTLTPAFPGTFSSWFRDGARFLTTAGTTVTVYSHAAAQQDIAVLPSLDNLGAQGGWFWSASPTALRIYAVGNGATPAATNPLNSTQRVVPGNATLAILDSSAAALSVVDLGGASPAIANYQAPLGNLSDFGSNSATDWAFSTAHGAMFGELNSGAPQRYAPGLALSIAGNGTRFAIATASGNILVYNSLTRALEGEIAMATSKLEISATGTRLAAGPGQGVQISNGRTLRVYELPSRAVLAEWPATVSDPDLAYDFSLSADGNVIGRTHIRVGNVRTREVTSLAGAPMWSDNGDQPIRLTSDGSRIAVASGGPILSTGTNIYVNGALSSAVTGWPAGWIDETRLLVNRYRLFGSVDDFDGVTIFDPGGQALATPSLPEMRRFQTVSSTSIYSPELNVILDLATGNALWTSGREPRGEGAVIGDAVVFSARAAVRLESR